MTAATARHGTHAGYVTDRCRCEECREAHRLYQREYRARITNGTFVFRSRPRDTDATALEQTLAKVREDFPAFSAASRLLAVMSA